MTDTPAPPPLDTEAILRHAEAMYEAAAREARMWHAVIAAVRGDEPTSRAGGATRSAEWGSRMKTALGRAGQYLTTHGSASSARVIEDWIATQGVALPRGKLRQYMWGADGVGYDAARGGWHLTAGAEPARGDPVAGVHSDRRPPRPPEPAAPNDRGDDG